MTRLVVEEVDGVFVLPIAGFVCEQQKATNVIARSESGVEAKLPTNDEELAHELVARRVRVERATVSRESTLRIEFDGGTVLEIPANDEFEAWEVSVAEGAVFAVAPAGGGEPAIWDASVPTYVLRFDKESGEWIQTEKKGDDQ